MADSEISQLVASFIDMAKVVKQLAMDFEIAKGQKDLDVQVEASSDLKNKDRTQNNPEDHLDLSDLSDRINDIDRERSQMRQGLRQQFAAIFRGRQQKDLADQVESSSDLKIKDLVTNVCGLSLEVKK